MTHKHDWQFDPATRRVTRGNTGHRLPPKASHVLEMLVAAQGGVVARAELLDQVWAGVTVGEEVLTHAIAELRRALGDDARKPRHIETVHKAGYRLVSGGPAPGPALPVRGGVDLDSYAAYLEGCELFYRGGRDNVARAFRLFHGIVDSDDRDALALAGLAKVLIFMDRYFGLAGDNAACIEAFSRRACELAPDAPESHATLGFFLAAGGRLEAAMDCFSTALALDPSHAETHYLLGRTCFAHGRFRTAAVMFERAAALRPDDFHALMLAAKARRFDGDAARFRANAVSACKRGENWLEAYPRDHRAALDIAVCQAELGRFDAAIAVADLGRDAPEPDNYYLVGALAHAGEIDRSLEALEQVITFGFSDGEWLKNDHDLDPLRGEPRFRRLAAAV